MASIRERKTKTGVSYTVLYDADGKRGLSGGTYTDPKEAETRRLEIELDQRRNEFIAPDDTTVEEFIRRWLPIRATNKEWEPNYLKQTTRHFELHVFPEIGRMKIQDVRPLTIETLFTKLRNTRCQGPKSYGKVDGNIPFLSGSTLASIYTPLKCAFDAAVTWEIIKKNPVTIEKPARGDTQERTTWSLSEITLVLDTIGPAVSSSGKKLNRPPYDDEQLHLLVHLAAAHTMRNGEMCGITLDTLNLDSRMLLVDKTMQRIDKESFAKLPQKEIYRVFPNQKDNASTVLVLKSPKTKGSVRWLYLTAPIIHEIRRRLQTIAKNKLYYGEDYQDYNLLFCLPDGSPLEPNRAEKWFNNWQKRNPEYNLPKVDIHGLRHSATTILMHISNHDAKTVQSITGHDSAEMVYNIYNHKDMDKQKQLIQSYEQVLYNPVSVKPVNELSTDDILQYIKEHPQTRLEVLMALNARHATHAGLSAC